MIVINHKSSLLSMPCGGGNVHQFMPGQNELDPNIWANIQKELEGRPENSRKYYALKLKAIGCDSDSDLNNETDLSFVNLDWRDAVRVIEATVMIDDLNAYKTTEEGREKPRKAVLSAIKSKTKEIQKIIEPKENG